MEYGIDSTGQGQTSRAKAGELENQTSRAKAGEIGEDISRAKVGGSQPGEIGETRRNTELIPQAKAISRAKAGEVGLMEYGIDSTGQGQTSRAKAGELENQTSRAKEGRGGRAEVGRVSSDLRPPTSSPSTLNAQPSTGKRPNVVCLPYQPLNELAASLSAADAHVVVMGEAMLGLVHPCKIYNILAVGAPVIYIGPKPSHVTEILDRLGDEYPSIRVMHGEADLLAEQIQCLRQSGATGKRQLPVETLAAFSQALLLPRLAALIEGAA
jgi:hypothetical protein